MPKLLGRLCLHVILLACVLTGASPFASERNGTTENPFESIYFQALAAEKKHNLQQALGLYQSYLSRDIFSVNKKNARFKVRLLNEGLKNNATESLIHYLSAINYRNEGQFDLATAELTKLTEQYSKSHFYDDAIYLMGFIELHDKLNYRQAIVHFRQIVEKFPDSNYFDTSFYSLGVAHENLGNYDVAKNLFSQQKARHAAFSIELFDFSVPSDDVLSRVWYRRAQERLEAMIEKQEAIDNVRKIMSEKNLAIAMGARFSYDQPVGSDEHYRYTWHLLKEHDIKATHITHWITRKTKWRWETKERLIAASNAGYTPIISYWYFGDQISPEFVEENLENYKTDIISNLIPLIDSLPNVTILLEPEFNKGGIENWPRWGEIASDVIELIKEHAPQAEVGLALGDWATKDQQSLFSSIRLAVEKSDFVGYIAMTSAAHENGHINMASSIVERVYRTTRLLAREFEKPLFLGYVAISSAQGWEDKQARYLSDLLTYIPYLMSQGLSGFGFFSLYDNPGQSGWFSSDERHFGLLNYQGKAKPGLRAWQNKITYLLNQDHSAPKVMSFSAVGDASLSERMQFRGELSEWSHWEINIRGVVSGAEKTFRGAGKNIGFSWAGLADRGEFLPETCRLFIKAIDKAGNTLADTRATQFDLVHSINLTQIHALNGKEIAQHANTWSKASFTDARSIGASLAMSSAFSGVQVALPETLTTTGNLNHVVDLEIENLSNVEGLRIGLRDKAGVNSYLPAEIISHGEFPKRQILRATFEDFPLIGQVFDEKIGRTHPQAIDKNAVRFLVISNQSAPINLDVRQMTVYSGEKRR